MKKIFFAILFVFLIPNFALAFEKKSGDRIIVSEGETVEGSLFVSANTVDIRGVVDGDVFSISPKLEISGVVNGDIIAIGEDFDLTGTSTGNIRLLFKNVSVSGSVFKNATVIADQLKTDDSAKIGGEFFLLSSDAKLAGKIDRDLYGGVESAQISSLVGGGVFLRQGASILSDNKIGSLKLLSGANIEGNFNYRSGTDLVREDGSFIRGKESKSIFTKKEESSSPNLFWPLISIFSNILISFVLIALFKNFLSSSIGIIESRSFKSFWLGLLLFFLFPLTFILLFLTVIGIPLAVISLFIFLGMILINKAILAIILGEKVLGLIKSKRKDSLNLRAIIGVPLLYFIFQIPFLGPVLSFFGLLLVIGAILEYFRTKLIN